MQTFIEYEKRDFAVGAFVILSAIVILAVIFVKVQWSAGYYTIIAEFSRISNLNESTKVRLRGYEIGFVKKIHFHPEAVKPGVYFQVELAIQSEYRLYEGTKAKIQGGGLVGDRFIELDVPEQPGAPLEPLASIPGEMPDDLGETLGSARDMMQAIARMARRIDDGDIGGKFALFVRHVLRIKDAVERMSHTGTRAFQSMDGMFADLRPELGQAMDRLNANMVQLGGVLGSADTILVENRDQIRLSLESLNTSLVRLQNLLVNLDSLTTDGRDEILRSLDNVEKASRSLQDLSKHPWKFFTGDIDQ